MYGLEVCWSFGVGRWVWGRIDVETLGRIREGHSGGAVFTSEQERKTVGRYGGHAGDRSGDLMLDACFARCLSLVSALLLALVR